MTTYKESGVDVEAGDAAVDRIKPIVQQTFTPGVLAGIGSFGSYVELDADAYEKPVLVSSIDGVGTKVNVAVRTGTFDTVGQDLVNHCVNDIAVCGARPLYFLDYYGVGSLDPDVAEQVVSGFATACKETGTALVGGEIAEMPDVYGEHFDLVGCIVGVVEKSEILNGSTTREGDVLVGLPSTGLHTNGYTLARTVLFEHFDVDDTPDELGGETVGDALLRVHRSYLSAIHELTSGDRGITPRGFAHITGGGLPGNLRRIMPDGLQAVVDYGQWKRPALFSLIQDLGDVPEDDMRQTFNCGIGLVGAFPPDQVDAVLQAWTDHGEHPVVIGAVKDA